MKALVIITHDELRELVKFYLEAHYSIQVQAVSDPSLAIPELMNIKDLDFIVSEYSEFTKKISVFCTMKKMDIPIFCISSKMVNDPVLDKKKDWIHWIDPAVLLERFQCELETRYKKLSDLPTEPRYVRIVPELLLLASPLPGGVYVKLSDLKHVCLLKVGYDFTQKDIDHLVHKKNVQFLFVKQQDISVFALKIQYQLAGYFQKGRQDLNKADVKADGSSGASKGDVSKAKVSQTQLKRLEKDLSKGFEIAQTISGKMGFTSEVQALTRKNVNEAIKIIRNIPSLSLILTQITQEKEKYISSHSMLLAYLACALGSQLEWRSDMTYQKFTLAAFLHDLPLKNQELASIQNLKDLETKKGQFTALELKEFREHPLVGADIVRGFNEIPPDVDVIIAQHHERPDGKGFPRGLTSNRISPLASVFIVAHDWVSYLYQNDAIGESGNMPDIQEYLKSREEIFSGGNFKKVLNAGALIRK